MTYESLLPITMRKQASKNLVWHSDPIRSLQFWKSLGFIAVSQGKLDLKTQNEKIFKNKF